jgi:carbon-monoxide dehydrogenase medium subunit
LVLGPPQVLFAPEGGASTASNDLVARVVAPVLRVLLLRRADAYALDALELSGEPLAADVVAVALPPDTGWGFEEVAQRHGDFAIAAVAATVTVADGKAAQVRLAAMGVGETPLRLGAVEAQLQGQPLDPALIAAAAHAARHAVEPGTDLRGSADYRRHLVAALTERALAAAWRRAAA